MHLCSTRCPTSQQKITQWPWGNTTARRWPPRKKTVQRWLQTLPLRPQVKLWLEGYLQQCIQNPNAPHAKGGRPNTCWRRFEREVVPWHGNPSHRIAWLFDDTSLEYWLSLQVSRNTFGDSVVCSLFSWWQEMTKNTIFINFSMIQVKHLFEDGTYWKSTFNFSQTNSLSVAQAAKSLSVHEHRTVIFFVIEDKRITKRTAQSFHLCVDRLVVDSFLLFLVLDSLAMRITFLNGKVPYIAFAYQCLPRSSLLCAFINSTIFPLRDCSKTFCIPSGKRKLWTWERGGTNFC